MAAAAAIGALIASVQPPTFSTYTNELPCIDIVRVHPCSCPPCLTRFASHDQRARHARVQAENARYRCQSSYGHHG